HLDASKAAAVIARPTGMPATLALAALLALTGGATWAETYPDRPITVIVPYAAGGSSDVLARLLGERLSRSLGQPIVIDNPAGAAPGAPGAPPPPAPPPAPHPHRRTQKALASRPGPVFPPGRRVRPRLDGPVRKPRREGRGGARPDRARARRARQDHHRVGRH